MPGPGARTSVIVVASPVVGSETLTVVVLPGRVLTATTDPKLAGSTGTMMSLNVSPPEELATTTVAVKFPSLA